MISRTARTALFAAFFTAIAAISPVALGVTTRRPATLPGRVRTIAISETSNDKTVTVPVGDRLLIQLHSTYWTFVYPLSSALVKSSSSLVPGGAGCPKIMGSGRGVVSSTFDARAVATVRVGAHRTSCGEALLCTGAQGHWTARIRVVRA